MDRWWMFSSSSCPVKITLRPPILFWKRKKKKLLLPSQVVKSVLINTSLRRMLHLASQWGHSWRRACKKKKRKKKDVTHAAKADCQTGWFMQTLWLWCLISEPKPRAAKSRLSPPPHPTLHHACIAILECTPPTVQHWNYTTTPLPITKQDVPASPDRSDHADSGYTHYIWTHCTSPYVMCHPFLKKCNPRDNVLTKK